MKSGLIGYTGFVGSNLKKQYEFDDLYNSKNIYKIKNKKYDILICSGIPSSMWLANNNPKKDLQNIKNLLNVIISIKATYLVLISTAAVYEQPLNCFNENSEKFEQDLPYGRNRRYAESVIAENFNNYSILRLPALFGKNLKKNFIYDLLNQEPAYIPEDKFNCILSKLNENDHNLLRNYYDFHEDKDIFVFNKIKAEKNGKRSYILRTLKKADFTALNFTNAESLYQFYNLKHLKKDIDIAIDNNIRILNICSEPVKAKDIAKFFFNINYDNYNGKEPLYYDMKTIYAKKWDKIGDYQYCKDEVYTDLKLFFLKGKYNEICNI